VARLVGRLPSARVVVLESRDRVPHRAPCSAGRGPGVPGSGPASGSLLGGESASPSDPPPSHALCLSFSLSQINK